MKWLDLKIALRMLARYPMLTIVASAGMAFGIAAGVGGFELRTQFVNPTMPLSEGRRIVGIRNWDVQRDQPGPASDADFRAWREQLRTIEGLAAAALVERNLTVEGHTEPIDVAEITASGFRLARVLPLFGRTLVDADEQRGSPPVALIGYSLWQRRFLSDPAIVGRSVRLGTEQMTIVGVMPEGFGFPVAHQLWVPLKGGQPSHIFGRLVKGVTLNEAQAELTLVGRRIAAGSPDTHESLRPEVVPYAHLFFDPRRNLDIALGLTLANVFLIMLVTVVAANVALLMFARAASREREIGVRYALGASRGRIVAQMFGEGVALSGLSALLGLLGARYALGSVVQTMEANRGGGLPFWMNDSLTPSTIVYGIGLTILLAVIIGVFPALKITRGGLDARLRSFSAGGGYRFGGVWTAVIATQVAVTVLFPAAAFFFHRWVVGGQTRDVGVASTQYLSARLVMEPGTTRTAATVEELRRQLSAEPGVTAVAIADVLPGMRHPSARFEVEGDDRRPTYGYEVHVASVDADFFSAMNAPVSSGREFTPSDASGRDVAIVNASFVEAVLGGRNPVGHRIRTVARDTGQSTGPWIDIVGVVRDLGVDGEGIGLYRPLAPGSSTVRVAIHVGGSPESFSARLRAIASAVDPTLRVHDVMSLDRVGFDQWNESLYMSRLLAVLSGLALLLSLTAIYSVVVFTVLQRTREIGLRVALGASGWRVVGPIVRRPLAQIALGIALGAALVVLIFIGLFESTPTPGEAGLIAAYAMLMLGISLLACGVPTRRALRQEPSQVLRSDA